MSEGIVILSPVAPVVQGPQQDRHPLEQLAGKVVGFIDNSKPNFSNLVDDLAELLIDKYGVATVLKRAKGSPSLPAPQAVIEELYATCDVVITGAGD